MKISKIIRLLLYIICTTLIRLSMRVPFRGVKTCRYHIAYQVTTTTKIMPPWLSTQLKNTQYDSIPGEINELSEKM